MILGFTGLPGQSKTLQMTMYGYKYWLAHKCPVYANYNLRFPINDVKKKYNKHVEFGLFPLKVDLCWQTEKQQYYYPYCLNGEDFIEAFKQVDNALFLIDEMGSTFSNLDWRSFKPWVLARFRESRHVNLEIMYTAQNIGDVNNKIRQLTNYEVKCRFYQIKLKNPKTGLDKFVYDIAAKSDVYHHEVIMNDTETNRKQYKSLSQLFFRNEFMPFYKLYNTYEKRHYDAPEGKDLASLIKPNKFETGEFQ